MGPGAGRLADALPRALPCGAGASGVSRIHTYFLPCSLMCSIEQMQQCFFACGTDTGDLTQPDIQTVSCSESEEEWTIVLY